ncbi:hybrid sensor histidine kinase/response regulator [Melaminivora suipulveris]|uniref:Chemotaxis protein CheA n=1 Tax=Melaminivora suipulveris TaxID=2109913 RepID=A0A2R3QDT5_9BURK|nr:Hpt domain-containing protein [Melaminivora suipulveris]AVO49935.1 hybrid sensor histidine kinase/response regulator [Melaminivora suipulveris]
MSTKEVANATAPDGAHGEQDLGPLAWVLDELRKTLEGAAKAMRRFVRDAEVARQSDLASLDASALRVARQQLHQAGGALEMVGMAQPALVVRALEGAVQRFVQRPELCSDEACGAIEQASFALVEYLELVLAGRPVSPVALFPQYRRAQELAGAERVHPADLWPPQRPVREPAAQSQVPPVAYGSQARARLDSAVLRIVKTADAAAAAELKSLSLGLAAGQEDAGARTFWRICAGFFEALAQGALPPDVYVKRVASRVLMQYASLARGDAAVNERLLQDLLFFCAQAAIDDGRAAPALAAVRQANLLDGQDAVDYEQTRFGLYDPAVLAQARKRIAAATETWSALAGGDRNKLKLAADQFSLVCDSLRKLQPGSEHLAQALMRAVEVTAHSGEPPGAALAIEVATAVLYLQASFEDLDVAPQQMAERAQSLAQRIDQVGAGGEPQPLEPWMEELYGRVSERQTMGSVVGELRASLAEAEKAMDQYFRDPQDTAALTGVPGGLQQMRGVLSVLGLDQASLAVLHMRTVVERLLVGDVPDGERAQVFEKLGNSLGALGFLIDMLSYQRAMARKLFVYDEAQGELRSLMGRARTQPVPAVRPDEPALQQPQAEPAEPAFFAAPPLAEAAAPEIAPPAPMPAAPAFSEPPVATPAVDAARQEEDQELRDIFLEEAREVVAAGLAAVDALHAQPGDLSQQTTLRRAFHTLKGSSRMVGLNEFGEAAWAMEQALNAWLAEQKPIQPPLLQLSAQALTAFGQWADAITADQAGHWQAQPFRTAADAMRQEGRLVELDAPHTPSAAAPPALLGWTEQVEGEGSSTLDGPPTGAAEPAMQQPAAPDLPPAKPTWESEPLPVHERDTELAGFDLVAEGDEGEPPADFADTSIDGLLDAQDDASLAMGEEIDFALFEKALQAEASPPPAPADAAPAEQVAPHADTETFFLAPGSDSVELLPGSPESSQAPGADEIPWEAEVEPVESAAPLDLPELTAQQPAPQLPVDAVPDPGLEPGQPLLAAAPDEPPADEVKVIGSLRIGIPLYNVYLNEADEWSRRLATALQEWALELHQPVPEVSVALAHSLAGSSATVGFSALSGLARTLEHALQHLQLLPRGTSGQAQAVNAAAADIRRLLHQFAAGFLKEPNAQVLAQLRELLELEVLGARPAPADPAAEESRREGAGDDSVAGVPAPEEALRTEAFTAEGPSAEVLKAEAPELEATADEIVSTDAADAFEPPPHEPAAEPHSAAEAPAAATTAQRAPGAFADIPPSAALPVPASATDDDIDALDTIDPDLFPIFEEEATELLPRLGSALRQWSAHPDNLGARSEVLRALHTLKGSARLAGAMRLGEMAHRLEGAVEHIGMDGAHTSDIEPLLVRLDALQADFDTLRAVGAQPLSEPVTLEPPAPAQSAPEQSSQTAEPASVAQPTVLPAVELAPQRIAPARPAAAGQSVRVRAQLLDRLVNQAGEVMIARSRLEARMGQLRGSLTDLTGNLERLRLQLRDIEVQAESQMQSRLALSRDSAAGFDPLEFDRFTRVQELTRMMAESVNDVATVQRNMQRAMEGAEDDLIAQGRQARELQRDLLRTRMIDFESIAERLYAAVRQSSKEAARQVKLDIVGGAIEMDRGVLDRMTPVFEHLLRNSISHGIEPPEQRQAAGKPAAGTITIALRQEGNDVSLQFRDDGAGLDVPRIRAKAVALGLVDADAPLDDAEAVQLIFQPGFSTAAEVTELSGRGIGMDVVRAEVGALGGRIETESERGRGTSFRLVLPLTTAVTQVVMLRAGDLVFGVPASLVEIVRRANEAQLDAAYASRSYDYDGQALPLHWAGALLQSSARSGEAIGKSRPVLVLRSAAQRLAMHVDEVLGNQEVVVKNLGPQLSRLPGLAGMSVLASGAVVLVYNPVALATTYGEQMQAAALLEDAPQPAAPDGADDTQQPPRLAAAPQVPLVLVVDDSITVRRVTQRLLVREGYRVALAADGLQALERLQEERPAVVLSDIEMPRMDGFDLARNIRADAKLQDLPIIMITSRIAQKHRDHAMELGVNHYLGKPYSDEELLSLVQHYARQLAPAESA